MGHSAILLKTQSIMHPVAPKQIEKYRKVPWKNQNQGECQPVPYVFPRGWWGSRFPRYIWCLCQPSLARPCGSSPPYLVVLALRGLRSQIFSALEVCESWPNAKKIRKFYRKIMEHRDFAENLLETPGNSRSLRSFLSAAGWFPHAKFTRGGSINSSRK